MKCKFCGKKVFKDLKDEFGRIGRFRQCVNCNTLNVFGWDIYEEIKKRNEKIVEEVKAKNEHKEMV